MTWVPAAGPQTCLLIVSEDAREFGYRVYNSCPTICSLQVGPPTPLLEVALALTPIVVGASVNPAQRAPVAVGGRDPRLIRRFRQLLHSTTSPIIDCHDVQLYLEFSVEGVNNIWFSEMLAEEFRRLQMRLRRSRP